MKDEAQVHEAVAAVGRTLVAASRFADRAAEESATCISTLIAGRREADLPLDTALEEVDLLASALRTQLAARAELFRARLALVRLPRKLEVHGYGASCPCDQEERRTSGVLVDLKVA